MVCHTVTMGGKHSRCSRDACFGFHSVVLLALELDPMQRNSWEAALFGLVKMSFLN